MCITLRYYISTSLRLTMPCFFCNIIYHPSHLCETRVTDESRIKVAESKDCCVYCLSDRKKHVKTDGNKPSCVKNAKCYGCFSKGNHFSFYCPQRFTAPKLFVPEIDKDLLPRFIAMFDALEQYSIGFVGPDVEKVIKFKPMKIYVDKELTPESLPNAPTFIMATLKKKGYFS